MPATPNVPSDDVTLINAAHRDRFVDLSGSSPIGQIIGFSRNDSANQKVLRLSASASSLMHALITVLSRIVELTASERGIFQNPKRDFRTGLCPR